MNKIKEIIIESIKLTFNYHLETFKILFSYKEKILYTILASLQLWCLNLAFYFAFIIITPLLVQNNYIIEAIILLTKFWFIEGIKYQLWFWGICFLFVLCNLDEL